MGARKQRREKFFAAHPWCCFCGGDAKATTQDHFPSRSLFTGREFPMGYVFPACQSCQSASVDDEILVKLLATCTRGDTDGPEIERTLGAVQRRFPDVYRSFRMTTAEKRAAVRQKEITVAPGQTICETPLISISHPRIHEAIRRFATKLFCALFYFHTNEVLPSNSMIYFAWYTNAQPRVAETFAIELAAKLGRRPELRSQRTSLEDQFRYLFELNRNVEFASFLCGFHNSFALAGFIFAGRTDLEPISGTVILRPLAPARECH